MMAERLAQPLSPGGEDEVMEEMTRAPTPLTAAMGYYSGSDKEGGYATQEGEAPSKKARTEPPTTEPPTASATSRWWRQRQETAPTPNATWKSRAQMRDVEWMGWVRVNTIRCPEVWVPTGTCVRVCHRDMGWYSIFTEADEPDEPDEEEPVVTTTGMGTTVATPGMTPPSEEPTVATTGRTV